jgi:hypothetical protein
MNTPLQSPSLKTLLALLVVALLAPPIRANEGPQSADPYVSPFGTGIPVAGRTAAQLPVTPGTGVRIELFNGLGGGGAPTPGLIAGRVPSGVTLSPFVDFPRPNQIINVGSSFNTFFASTTTPPTQVSGLAARNFTLQITMLLRVDAAVDRQPATPGVQLSLGVGSDDGYHLTVGGVFLGSTGDRPFTYSWHNMSFEEEGLYPVNLLFAANAVGQSGLEFSWLRGAGSVNEIVPQASLYQTGDTGDQLITFEEVPEGTVVADQYQAQGVRFVTSAGLRATAAEVDFVPISAPRVLGDPTRPPVGPGRVEMNFVVPGSQTAAVTNQVGFYLIDAAGTGARVSAFNPVGQQVFQQTYNEGGRTQTWVDIRYPHIASVVVELGDASEKSALDQIGFRTPEGLRPVVGEVGNLAAVSGETSISFSWEEPANRGDFLAGYRIYLGDAPVVELPAATTTWLADGLAPASGQSFRITTLDAYGTESPGLTLNASTLLPNPTQVRLQPQGDSALLRWDAVQPVELVLRYDVYRADAPFTAVGAAEKIASVNVTEAQLGGLAGVFGGHFAVVAVNSLGSFRPEVASVEAKLPDLVVSGLTAAPENPLSGQTLTLQWNDSNQGNEAAASGWHDRVVIVNTTTGQTLLDTEIAYDPAQPGNGPIAAGDFRARSQAFALPDGPAGAGNLEITVTVDSRGNLSEQNADGTGESNNTATLTTAVGLAPYPDLVASEPGFPAQVYAGQPFEISWRLANLGDAAVSGTWSDKVELSADDQPGGDILLGTFAYTGTINPGQSVVRSQTVRTAADLVGGFHGIVTANSERQIYELVTDNNVAVAGGLTTVLRAFPEITSPAPPSADRVGMAYSHQCTADGMPPLAFSASGLPPGLTINSAGAISGTPTAWGTFNGTITAANGVAPNATQAFSITMVQPPVFTSAAPPADGRVGTAYTHTCTADGNTPVGFTLMAGALPTGLSLSEAGVISGIPEAEGTFTGMLRAANGTEPAATQDFAITIIQIPVLSLALDPTVIEGGTATGILSVAPVRATDLQVTLSSSRPTQLNPGPPVTIPAGQGSVPFTIRGIQDNVIEAATEVRVSASAAGSIGAEAVVMLLDDDWPILTLALDRTVVSEAAGPNAMVVTVSRDIASSQPLTVWLTNSDPAAVSLPETVTIPAGNQAVSFPLSVLDDTVADGPQTVMLRAEVRLPGVGVISQSPAVNLEVGDDEGARLEFVLERGWVLEGGSATATVRRVGGSTSEALTVHLAASPSDELALAAAVEIPAGADTAEFSLSGVVDAEQDGNTVVRLEGNATGYSPAQAQLVVTDRTLPDLVAMNIGAPTDLETEANFRVSYRIENQGAAATSSSFTQRILLSKDPVPGDDTLLSQFVFSGTMAAGAGFDRSETVRAPREAGTYWLIVVADATQTLDEIFENNNTVLMAQPLTVGAAYGAVVSTGTTQVPANTPLVFSGSATRPGGAKVPHVMVNIHIRVAGTERIIAAITNSVGDFSVTWQPLPGEGGDYEIGACHPGVATAPTQDSFAILTVKPDFPGSTIAFDEGASASFTGTLTNPTAYDLTGMTLVAVNPPAGLTVGITLPATTLAARQTAQAGVTLTGAAGFVGNGTVQLLFSTDQGVTLDLSIPIQVRPLVPQLVIAPASLRHSVLRGEQKSLSFQIANTGGAATGDINLLLPDLPWLQLASPVTLPSLAPGASASVSLLLAPSASQALTLYSGSLVVDPEIGASRSVPFEFRVVSALTGDLEVEVVDESYFFTAAAPKVAGAAVVLRDAISSEQVAKLDTPVEGRVRFPAVPEGWYRLEVTAPNHTPWNGNMYINAGETNFRQVFISRQWVTYNWKVEEIEIEDRYRISVETTFETNVPAPVVTIAPGVLNVEDLTTLGQSKVINFTIENHGLIAADHGNFDFDQHPFYEVTPLIRDIGLIPAKSSITIPVTVRKIGEYAEDGSIRYVDGIRRRVPRDGTSVPCGFQGKLEWDYVCGIIPVPKWTSIPASGVQGDCRGPSGPGGTPSSGWIWSGPTGGSVGPNLGSVSFTDTRLCPCPSILPSGSEVCLGVSAKVTLPSIASKVASAITKLIPAGGKLERIELEVGTSSKLCLCCSESGELGFSGNGEVKLKVTGEIKWGPPSPPALYVPPAGPWRIENSGWDFDLGFKLELDGEITVTVKKDCEGESAVCIQGSIGFTAFAGAEAEASVRATYLGAGPGYGNAYEGKVSGRLGGEISGGLQIKWCDHDTGDQGFRGYLKGKLVATLAGELNHISPDGTKDTRSISLGAEIPLFDLLYPPKSAAPPPVARAAADGLPEASTRKKGEDPYQGVSFDGVGFGDAILSDSEFLALPQFAPYIAQRDGVCATVKVKIDQEAVMTRSAFRGTLELSNNRPGSALKQVGFDLDIRDNQGNDAREFFNIQVTKLTGLAAIDGTGEIGPQSTGSAQWTMIPRDTAAPLADTVYTIGGTIRYDQDGTLFSIPVTAVPITVKPDAALYVKYFHQRDVFSDDPHTDQVEPAIPYALAVIVENRGAGSARNLRITSAQPEVVDNEKGLLIDFQIIGTEVAGQNLTPSLTATFGEIPPNQRKIANWWMTSSLQGLFIDYKATFEHLDGFGDPRLSLIKDLEIHELIHLIEAQGPLDDGLPDFLVNDVPDVNDFPDTVHLSNGGTAPVAVYQVAAVSGTPSQANPTVTLTADLGTGWAYLRIPDPANGGLRLIGVQRSDGRLLPLDRNAWTTDRTFVGLGQRPVREPILHLVDLDSTGSYTLTYEGLPGTDVTPPSSQVAALPPQSGVTIPVSWSGTDDQGISSFDIFVQIDGAEWLPWLTGTTRTSSIYQGAAGRSYGFYSRSTDRAGNVETKAAAADTSTLVSVTNAAPVITPIPPQVIPEGSTFGYQVSATDPDDPSGTLAYAVNSSAPGITIDPSGRLRWVTGEADGGSEVTAVITVTDSGSPAAASQVTVQLTVAEVNRQPVIQPVGPQFVEVGDSLNLPLSAADPDLPQQTLAFGFSDGPPSGMLIDPATGRITWTPGRADSGRSHPVTVTVTDSGTPPATGQMSFAVSVPVMADQLPVFGPLPTLLWLSGKSQALTVEASDPDGDPVTVTANLSALPGTPVFSGPPGSGGGTLTWEIPADTRGTFTVPLVATSGPGQAQATLRIRVENDEPYWQWLSELLGDLPADFDLALLDMDADPDGDRRGNVHEMAFLTHPLVPDSPPIGIEAELSDPFAVIRLNMHRRKGSERYVDFHLASSSELIGPWQRADRADWSAFTDPFGDDDGRAETEEIDFEWFQFYPGGVPPQRFYRIESTRK